jgi:hypothetical protein
VNVDLSPILLPNDLYEVYNVQDLFGVPVLSGTYVGGTVAFPTTGKAPPATIGTSPRTAPTTAPFFDAFLVRKTGSQPGVAGGDRIGHGQRAGLAGTLARGGL